MWSTCFQKVGGERFWCSHPEVYTVKRQCNEVIAWASRKNIPTNIGPLCSVQGMGRLGKSFPYLSAAHFSWWWWSLRGQNYPVSFHTCIILMFILLLFMFLIRRKLRSLGCFQSSAPSRVVVFTWSQPQSIAIFFMFRSKFSIEDRIGSRRWTVCNFSCSMFPESNSPNSYSWVRSWKVHSTFFILHPIDRHAFQQGCLNTVVAAVLSWVEFEHAWSSVMW